MDGDAHDDENEGLQLDDGDPRNEDDDHGG